MALNYIWISFFIIGFAVALVKTIFFGDIEVFQSIVKSTFDMSKTAFEISIGLTGVLTLWMGIMRVGERGGIVNIFSRIIGPFFQKLFPEVPRNHPAIGGIMLNFSANMLGLDNAATPLGLKAMESLQELNPKKDTASNAQIMFLVLNASGLTIIPITIMVYRAQLKAADPSDVFIPILIATFCSTLAGLIAVSIYQKINLLNRIVITWISCISLVVASIIWYFSSLPQNEVSLISNLSSNIILFTIIVGFILLAVRKKVNVYETFIDGAKEGFHVAVKIIPYLVAMLVAIGIFRASGAMDVLILAISSGCNTIGINTDFIPALPTGFMKPLSGSGSRGMMIDAMKIYGADSFAGKLACTVQGSSDTTFYVLTVYFGSVGVKKIRHALQCSLIADFTGLVAAIIIGYLFFH